MHVDLGPLKKKLICPLEWLIISTGKDVETLEPWRIAGEKRQFGSSSKS